MSWYTFLAASAELQTLKKTVQLILQISLVISIFNPILISLLLSKLLHLFTVSSKSSIIIALTAYCIRLTIKLSAYVSVCTKLAQIEICVIAAK